MKRLLAGLFVVIATMLSAYAASGPERGPVRARGLDVANPQLENRVHRAGNVWMNITNGGFLGNDGMEQSGASDDPCPPNDWAPQCEYPAGSGQQYLYRAAFWIGALITEQGYDSPRVSVGFDGWFDVEELFPGEGEQNGIIERSNLPNKINCFDESVYSSSARANEEFIATYSDTLTDPFWVNEDTDGTPHYPLGVRVQQSSMTWSSADFGDFVIVEYRARNIGSEFLKNVYVGLYVDSDVGPASQSNHQTDDIAGFRAVDPATGDTVNIAWIADNDGRPPSASSGPFDCPHIAGAYVLVPPSVQRQFSFNWWVSHQEVAKDFGPAWQSHADFDSGGMGWSWLYGTPMGDLHKYQIMSNGEIDYDQIMVNHVWDVPAQVYADPFTGASRTEPWSTSDPSPDASDIANGYDSRYLLSWGPLGVFDYYDQYGRPIYRLNPGEEFTMTFAYVLGSDFHDVDHPQPTNQTIDSSLFSWDGLMENARRAKYLFDHTYTLQPPSPPIGFGLASTSSGKVDLAWSPPALGNAQGYDLYGTNLSSGAARSKLNPALITTTMYSVTGLTNGQDWLFQLQAVDDSNWVSQFADLTVRVAAAEPVMGLEGVTENGDIWLHWAPSPEENVSGYLVLRRSNHGDSTSQTTSTPRYADLNVETGRVYTYWVVAQNLLGIASLPSDSVTLVPMALQQRILVIDETAPTSGADLMRGGVSSDSVVACYASVLSELGEGYDRIVQPNGQLPVYDLDTLSHYDLVIWHSEDNKNPISYDASLNRESALTQYVSHGGRLLRFARRFLNGSFGVGGRYRSGSLLSMFQPLDFDSLHASTYTSSTHGMEFVGATSAQAGFSNLTLDTVKVYSLTWSAMHYHFLPEVDILWPHAPTRVLYRSQVTATDTSGLVNQPCAVIGPGEILFAFPLYFLSYADARTLVNTSISALRAMDAESPRVSLGVVQNPIETSYLDFFVVSNEQLFTPLYVHVSGTTTNDSASAIETALNSSIYQADYRLTTSDSFSLSVTVSDLSGNTSSASHSFRSHYASPNGPAITLSTPGGRGTILLPAGAFERSGYLLLNSESSDTRSDLTNALSSAVTIGSPSWRLSNPATLSIHCDVTSAFLANRSVMITRFENGVWRPVSGTVTINGSTVSMTISQLGTFAVFEGTAPPIPVSTALRTCYPNPFNPSTTLRFTLGSAGRTQLVLYNLLGQQVRTLVDTDLPIGSHEARWDGTDFDGRALASGIYLAQLRAPDGTHVTKLALVR
jgi:hypothetical protein